MAKRVLEFRIFPKRNLWQQKKLFIKKKQDKNSKQELINWQTQLQLRLVQKEEMSLWIKNGAHLVSSTTASPSQKKSSLKTRLRIWVRSLSKKLHPKQQMSQGTVQQPPQVLLGHSLTKASRRLQ